MGARKNFSKRWGCMVFEDVFSGSIEMGKIYSVYYSVMTKTDKTGFKSIRFFYSVFTFPKVLESAQEISKVSSCFVLWEP